MCLHVEILNNMFEDEIVSSNLETIKKHRKCRFTAQNIEYLDTSTRKNDEISTAKALKCIKILDYYI